MVNHRTPLRVYAPDEPPSPPAPIPDPTPPGDPADPPEPDDDAALGEAGKTALANERKARRDAERKATAATRELDKLRQASMSEQEKAVAAAREEGRTEALKTTGVKLVDAEVRAAAAGRQVDVDTLLDGLDRTKFVDDNGDPDRKAISEWIDKLAPARTGNGFPDMGQGSRGSAGSGTSMNDLIRSRMR